MVRRNSRWLRSLRRTTCRNNTLGSMQTKPAPAAATRVAADEVWPADPYFRSKFLATNNALAGRSARRRMKYGYHSAPKGI
jgi:hypothetical protein